MSGPTFDEDLNRPAVRDENECDHLTLCEPHGEIKKVQPTKISDVCALLEKNNPPEDLLSIFFLPKFFADKPGQKTPVLLYPEDLCRRLSTAMHIDPHFFTKNGWESNGFFMTPASWTNKNITYHSSTSRFLIKILEDEKVSVGYNWLFISFCVISVKREGDNEGGRPKFSQIVVCFDDCSKKEGHELMYESIMTACKDYVTYDCASHPVGMQGVLVRALAFEYDKALWRFREPVRDVEKARSAFMKDILRVVKQDEKDILRDESEDQQNKLRDPEQAIGTIPEKPRYNTFMEKYDEMAEISRHVIHMKETLQAAARVVGSILEESKGACSSHQPQIDLQVSESLRFSRDLLENLQLRTEAFVERLQNEISLLFNILNAEDLKATQDLVKATRTLVQESKDEGRDMTAILTLVTLAFFPSTVISGIFGMNFFAPSTDNRRIESTPDIWMFVLIDVVMTAIPLILYLGVHYLDWKPFGFLRRPRENR